MAVHLLKLCVGPGSIDELARSIETRLALETAKTGEAIVRATTRMAPKRREDLLSGGSLYWVIRGAIVCRQRVLDLREGEAADGSKRCHIILEPELVATEARACRPFQGWRYLKAEDAPADLPARDMAARGQLAKAPPEMRRALMELCLI